MSELHKIEHMLLGHGVVKAVSSGIILALSALNTITIVAALVCIKAVITKPINKNTIL